MQIIHVDVQDTNLDITITDEYLKLERKYGTEKVLALLAGPHVSITKKRIRREASTEPTTTAETEDDEGPFIYNAVGKYNILVIYISFYQLF